jgi:putative heme-binding domain-containing protein
MARMTNPQLVAALDSPNGWQRDAAQQLLVQRDDATSIAGLEKLAATCTNPLARLHAICTLGLLGKLRTEVIVKALGDESSGVRCNALRLAESHDEPAVIDAAASLAGDPDPQVRLQLAFSLGAWKSDVAATSLGELFAQQHADPHLAAAVMTSLNAENVEATVIAALASGAADAPLGDLLTQAASLGRLDSVAKSLEAVWNRPEAATSATPLKLLAATFDVMERRKLSVDQLCASAPDADSFRARLTERLTQAEQTAFDTQASDDLRAASIALVGRGPSNEDSLKRLGDLLSPQSAPQLQQNVVAYLATRGSPAVAAILLANWKSHTPNLRHVLVDALLRRPEWTAALLDAIEQRKVLTADLDALARQRLTTHGSSKLRARAKQLLAASGDASRQQVLAEYQSVLNLKGDSSRGAEVFKTKCAVCHRLGEVGNEVGPNLAALTDKSPKSLLTAMLDPSQAVEARYVNYIAQTSDGLSLSGLLQSETANSVTLVGQNGQQTTVLRTDLEVLQSTGRSLMPEGMEKDLKPQDFADLMAHLQRSIVKPK